MKKKKNGKKQKGLFMSNVLNAEEVAMSMTLNVLTAMEADTT